MRVAVGPNNVLLVARSESVPNYSSRPSEQLAIAFWCRGRHLRLVENLNTVPTLPLRELLISRSRPCTTRQRRIGGHALAEAHNHHFVPQGYLRRFADGVGRKARVHVCDRVEKRSFTTLVRNIAAIRDFNRIEAAGHHPNALEDAYAEFEGPAAEALVRIQANGSLESEEDRTLVLNLVALLAARNPRNRETFGDFAENIIRRMMELMVSNKDRWENLDKEAKAANSDNEHRDVSYEDMRAFVQHGNFDIEIDRILQISLELGMLQPVLEMLAQRKWTLHIASEQAGDFVTSDHPVVLMPVGWNPGPYGVGYGLANTVAIFPLNRRMLLTGRFEGEEKVLEASARTVAMYNRYVILNSQRQVYSFDDGFRYLEPDVGFKSAAQLMVDPAFVG